MSLLLGEIILRMKESSCQLEHYGPNPRVGIPYYIVEACREVRLRHFTYDLYWRNHHTVGIQNNFLLFIMEF